MKATCKCGAVLRIPSNAEGVVTLRCPVCSRRVRVHATSHQAVAAGGGRPDKPGSPQPTDSPKRPASAPSQSPQAPPADSADGDPLSALAYSVETAPDPVRRLHPGKRTISVAHARERDQQRAELFEKRLTLTAVLLGVAGLVSAVIPLPLPQLFAGTAMPMIWPIGVSIQATIWPLWLYWLAAAASGAVGLWARKQFRGVALLCIWGGIVVVSVLYSLVARYAEQAVRSVDLLQIVSSVMLLAILGVLAVAHIRLQVRGGSGLRGVGAIAGGVLAAGSVWQLVLVIQQIRLVMAFQQVTGQDGTVMLPFLGVGLMAAMSAAAGIVCLVNSLRAHRRRKLSAMVLCLIYTELGIAIAVMLAIAAIQGTALIPWALVIILLTVPGAGLLLAGIVAVAVWAIRGQQPIPAAR